MRVLPFLVCLAMSIAPTQAASLGLDGDWAVDLSTATSGPYTQPMRLRLKPDGTVDGSFYNSSIEAGRWKDDRGRLCASFRTSDGVGPYHTSVCLSGDIAAGQTWAEHRSFLFNWTASRVVVDGAVASP